MQELAIAIGNILKPKKSAVGYLETWQLGNSIPEFLNTLQSNLEKKNSKASKSTDL